MDQRSVVLNRLTGSFTQEPIIEVDLRSVEARRTVGRYHLDFVMRVDFVASAPYADEPTMVWLWADVIVTRPGGSQQELGRAALPDALACHQPKNHPQPVMVSPRQEGRLRLTLDREQLDVIETVRAESDGLTFTFRVGGVAHNAGRMDSLQPGMNGLSMDVAQSTWLEVLRQFGYSSVMSFAFAVPADGSGGVRAEATRSLQQAIEAFNRRAYDESIADCRVGLVALTRDGDGFDLRAWGRDAGKEERFWRVAKGLLSVSHAAHHPELPDPKDEQPAAPVRFDRQDAHSTIAILAALISQRS